MSNENNKETKDIFFRKNYKFMVAYNLDSKVEKVLKDNFKITDIKVIEPKDDETNKQNTEGPAL